MPYDDSNIFAKILRREAPCYLVEEDEHTLTMMDIMPRSEGHALVIPKEPCENIFEISDTALNKVVQQTKRVATASKKAFGSTGVMIVQLNGAGAGQSVFHLHFHVIPRSEGFNLNMHGVEMASEESLQESAEKLKNALVDVR